MDGQNTLTGGATFRDQKTEDAAAQAGTQLDHAVDKAWVDAELDQTNVVVAVNEIIQNEPAENNIELSPETQTDATNSSDAMEKGRSKHDGQEPTERKPLVIRNGKRPPSEDTMRY
jgi:hypothetical protein